MVLPFLGFALAMFLFYSTVPVILKVDWMYFIAFGAVAVGLVIYSGSNKNDENIAQAAEAKERDEESGLNNLVQQSTTTSRDLRSGDVKQQCSTSGDVAK